LSPDQDPELTGPISALQLQARQFVEDAGERFNVEAGFQAFLDPTGRAVFCVSILRNPLNLDRPTLVLSLFRSFLEGSRFDGDEESMRLDLLRRFEAAFGTWPPYACAN